VPGDVVILAAGPDVVSLGFLINQANYELAGLRDVRQKAKGRCGTFSEASMVCVNEAKKRRLPKRVNRICLLIVFIMCHYKGVNE